MKNQENNPNNNNNKKNKKKNKQNNQTQLQNDQTKLQQPIKKTQNIPFQDDLLQQQFLDDDDDQGYNYDSQDQGIEDYKIGGYHPVHIGEIIINRYVIIQKLGWGHFSTVWLAKDFKYNNYVALKIQKSAPHYLEAAYDQVQILQRVQKCMADPKWHECLKQYYAQEQRTKFTKDDTHVISLLNSFLYKGPYGNHFCFVFEILGVNLYQIVKRYNYKGIPLHLCRKIAQQVLIGLDFLHRFCGVIHTDLKPENVLLCLSQSEITQIVQNGRLNQTKAYQERIKSYQEAFGIKIEPEPKLINLSIKKTKSYTSDNLQDASTNINKLNQDEQNQKKQVIQQIQQIQKKLETEKLSKTQKKNLKKKLKKLKSKEGSKIQQPEEIQQVEEKQNDEELLITDNINNKLPQQEKKQQYKPLIAGLKPIDLNINFKQTNIRGPKLPDNFKIKIADLGNACWTHHHFATQIQTRQYRSPQTILGIKYDTSADIWSFACMMYEMLTGQLMFQPTHSRDFRKNQHHLALIQERIGKFPKKFKLAGKKSNHYFGEDGQLKNFKDIQYVSISDVLTHKIRMKVEEAKQFQKFMIPLLNPYPYQRMKAHQALKSQWLTKQKIPFKMNQFEYTQYVKEAQDPFKENYSQNSQSFDADKEDSNIESEEDDSDFYGQKGTINIKLVDESFSKFGYIGYCDGLNVHELDQIPNWQFS